MAFRCRPQLCAPEHGSDSDGTTHPRRPLSRAPPTTTSQAATDGTLPVSSAPRTHDYDGWHRTTSAFWLRELFFRRRTHTQAYEDENFNYNVTCYIAATATAPPTHAVLAARIPDDDAVQQVAATRTMHSGSPTTMAVTMAAVTAGSIIFRL